MEWIDILLTYLRYMQVAALRIYVFTYILFHTSEICKWTHERKKVFSFRFFIQVSWEGDWLLCIHHQDEQGKNPILSLKLNHDGLFFKHDVIPSNAFVLRVSHVLLCALWLCATINFYQLTPQKSKCTWVPKCIAT